ncbi:MAG: C39 family peptidase [Parachlamydiaceae bacterium]|nr:C39 family peptidase [Parachlamydiaceae bacterium]
MNNKTLLQLICYFVAFSLLTTNGHAHHSCDGKVEDTLKNNIPPRLQWNSNSGYCGEVCLISAGLYFGQYLSQYDARKIAGKNALQNKTQLLLGINDKYAASQMHLNSIEWNTSKEKNTKQFLTWVKKNVLKGYPVAIGIYTNEYLFYGKTNPNAGDPDYDHIVPVTGISSNHSLSNLNYFDDDIIYFSDNGLWDDSGKPTFNFKYPFGKFQASRVQANAKKGSIYSLPNNVKNYGIVITGVMDLNGDTLPVRLATNINFEKPEIKNNSNVRPAPMPIILTITISDLEPHVHYNLYKYNKFSSVPNSKFNAHASQASESWQIQIKSGSHFVMSQQINSDEMAIFRAVKATAP